ncbi:MAG: hypothetical protein Unbinned5123contig1000_26 [Prokaryotic dsDNA virus sp.]|nr:MAG: hypothetical protein Unbinned5123contig1000_26 [Prokaryotic dsDNA virus sp.]|tara:strand:- start:30276 stop:30533 length:258 start_codon:yes stop_codon:yes gene_type:complete
MTLYPKTKDISNKNGCCIPDNLMFNYYGDGVEWEVWKCDACNAQYTVPIEIVRDFKNRCYVRDTGFKRGHNPDSQNKPQASSEKV